MPNIHIGVGGLRILDLFIINLNALVTDVTNLVGTMSGHTHGGVAAGAASTDAGPSLPAPTSQAVLFHPSVSTLVILRELAEQMEALRSDIATAKSVLDGHTHEGVTAGGGSTAAGPTVTVGSVPRPSIFESRRGRRELLRVLVEEFNRVRADFLALHTAMNGHTHGGVATGAASTAAGPSSPALTADATVRLVA